MDAHIRLPYTESCKYIFVGFFFVFLACDVTCVLQAAIPEAAPLLRSYVATHLGPRGNEQSLKVKLGNYITENLVP